MGFTDCCEARRAEYDSASPPPLGTDDRGAAVSWHTGMRPTPSRLSAPDLSCTRHGHTHSATRAVTGGGGGRNGVVGQEQESHGQDTDTHTHTVCGTHAVPHSQFDDICHDIVQVDRHNEGVASEVPARG